MSDDYLDVDVTNATGGTIASYWVKHKPEKDSTHTDWGFGTAVQPDGNGTGFQIKVESGTDDTWTVSWVDANNNLHVSDKDFKGKVLLSQGNLTVKIEDMEVEVRQLHGDESKEIGNSGYTQYGAGTNTHR